MLKKTLLVLLPLTILVGGWYLSRSENTDSPDSVRSDSPSDTSIATNTTDVAEAPNPLTIKKDDTAPASNNGSESNSSASTTDIQRDSGSLTEPVTSADSEEVEPSLVAVEPLTDEEFNQLEQQLKNDRQLRLSLLEEFRYNTDPTRAKQLAALLAPYDDPEILQIASELAYSGDPQSRIAGLDLLRRIQPRSDDARDLAIDLLSTGDSTEMLVATMNVLATPSRRASDTQLQSLNDNLNNLSNHHDATVRSQSLSLMARWDKNSGGAREALTRGLTDPDPSVRSSATYALNNISNPDEHMIAGLLSIAENTSESKPTRFAALRALENMQLSATQRRRYATAKLTVNRR